jgi:hypothetical protein
VGPDDDLERVLSVLTEHFRDFAESGEPPLDTGDIYLDLARAKKGVCRHRAYGFVITAQALGIPARFVYNEAHSWVEVKMPEVGFMRIDLGGAAEGLEAQDALDRPIHRPAMPDPLPKPPAYRESYSQLRGNVSGLRTDSGEGPVSRSRGDHRQDGSGASGAAFGSGRTGSDADELGSRAGSEELAPGEGAFPYRSPGAEDEQARRPLVLTVERSHYEVFRGREVPISGRTASPDGDGVAGLRVEVLLRGPVEVLLGVTVSQEHGWFEGRFGVPPDLEVGDYRLVVRTPGNEDYAPAMAR